MKKDALLNLAHFNKYCKSYFPTMQIICDYGFTYINLKSAVRSFLPLNNCFENFWECSRKIPVVGSSCNALCNYISSLKNSLAGSFFNLQLKQELV